jgi:LuxR family transcriptional regulator, maltose regulon positive regulatory protein
MRRPPDEVLLVVDDYHVIEAPEVHRSVAFLLDHVPSALRLVVASRSRRWRGCGLGVNSASSVPGTCASPRTNPPNCCARRSAASCRTTSSRRSGNARRAGPPACSWPVSRCADTTTSPDFVAHFSGSHRYVLDYLAEEVLDRQPEPLAAFLLETSILDRLSGPLCDALLGRAGSQQVLEQVERANLFLIPLDEERRWWRYHHLFADLLRVRLQQRHPQRVPQLHGAAADWHERHGLADDAVQHALAAGDTDRAARIVEAHFEDQVLRLGEGATLTRWFSALPPAHARTMEELEIRGVAGTLAATGTTIRELRLFGTVGIDLARLPSRFASLLITPQFRTEQVLARRLEDRDVPVITGPR